MDTPEGLVHGEIVRRNERGEVAQVRQERSNDKGDPVPGEGAHGNDQEELVTTDSPAVCLGRVCRAVIVQTVHDRGRDEGCGPHHGGGPNKEATQHTSHAEAQSLGGDGKQDLETPTPSLSVEFLLRKEDIKGVTHSGTSSSHHGDDGVLLLVEGTGIERNTKDMDVRHECGPSPAHGVRNQLDDGALNDQAGVMLTHEQVHGSNNCAGDETNYPGSNGIHRQVRIVGVRHLNSRLETAQRLLLRDVCGETYSSAHFGVRRVLTKKRSLDGSLLLGIASLNGGVDGIDLLFL